MRGRSVFLLALAIAFAWPGCSQETSDEGYGSASVAALTSGDVDYVVITAESPPGNIVDEQTIEGDGSGNFPPVQFDDLAVGAYTFGARAYEDLDGLPHDPLVDTLLYEGTAPATITEGVQTGVTIFLQQSTPPDPFANTVPIFQSLVYTPANPRTDEVVTLTVNVTDPDVPPDAITLAWSAPGGGTLTPPLDQPSVDWTAPSTDGTYPVTITASDLSGATATLTANIGVSLRLGSAEVTLDLNTWPEVSNLVPDPTRINVTESTSLTLAASDPDSDDLAYAWSATGCAGIFSDATANPDFQLTDAQGGTDCTLSVNITDVDTVTALPRGGSNTADVTIATGPEVVPNSTCPCWDGGLVDQGGGVFWEAPASLGDYYTLDLVCDRTDTCGNSESERSQSLCQSDTGGPTRQIVVDCGSQFNPGSPYCAWYDANVSLQQGQWSHVAVTYDTNGATGEEVSIYLNGQAQAVLLPASRSESPRPAAHQW